MSNISLSFFSLRIYTNKKIGKNYLRLGDLFGESIVNVLYEYLNLEENKYIDNESKELVSKIIYFENIINEIDNRYFYDSINCIMESGNYGDAAKIVNTKKNFKTTHNQTSNEAALRPFGFSILFKNNCEMALLVIERRGRNSIKNSVHEFIKKAINYHSNKVNCNSSKRVGTLHIDVSNIYPVNYINKLIERGTFKNISLLVSKGNSDVSEDEPINSKKKVVIYKDPSYNNKRTLKKLMTDNNGFDSLAYLINEDETIDDLSYNVEMDGQTRTISLSTYRYFNITENISSQIVKDPKGHPTRISLFRAIDSSSLQYLKLLNVIGDDISGNPTNKRNNKYFFNPMDKDDFYAQ